MSDMEFHARVNVPGIDIEGDDARRLLNALQLRPTDLGPVLSGTRDGLEVIVATDGDTEADAARELYGAVTDCLRDAELGHLYPAGVDLEPA